MHTNSNCCSVSDARGKPVEVPLAVAEVLEHAQMQETELFERVHEMQQQ